MTRLTACVASVVLLGVSVAGHADLYVDWQSSSYTADPSSNYPTASEDSYDQLVWSQDTTPYTPSSGVDYVSMTNGSQLGPNDYLLDSVIVDNNGATVFGNFDHGSTFYSNSSVGGLNINVGYLYSVLFARTNFELGTWYLISAMSNAASYVYTPVPPSTPVIYDATIQEYSAGPPFTAYYDYQLVPEPISLSLYGLGIVAVWAGSRRRRQTGR